MDETLTEIGVPKPKRNTEVALIHTPGEGLWLYVPEGDTVLAFGGLLLAAIHRRLQVDKAWMAELTAWMATEFPPAVIH